VLGDGDLTRKMVMALPPWPAAPDGVAASIVALGVGIAAGAVKNRLQKSVVLPSERGQTESICTRCVSFFKRKLVVPVLCQSAPKPDEMRLPRPFALSFQAGGGGLQRKGGRLRRASNFGGGGEGRTSCVGERRGFLLGVFGRNQPTREVRAEFAETVSRAQSSRRDRWLIRPTGYLANVR